MTVSTTTSKVSYSGNGSTTAFAVSFYFLVNTHLKVVLRAADGTETVRTLGTDYTVTGAGNPSGGTVTMTTAPASGVTVVIARNVPQTQLVDYQPNDPFPANTHEQALDQLTMEVQQLQEQITRALKLSLTNTMTSTEFTVGASSRANKVLGFDAAGELSVTQELGTYRGNWASGVAYQQRDIIKDTSTNNIWICLTAHTSSGSQPISTNTDAAKWALLVDAAAATSSASAAASSASAAATSATNASNSASAASTSASNASTSATNAASSATAASGSASSASGSASAASTSATNAGNSATSAANSAAAAAAAVASGLYSAVIDKSANYTVVAGDAGDLIRVSTGSGGVTITLPQISTVSDGYKVAIVKWTGDTNVVTVARSGSDTINGAASATIGSQYTQITFVADFETNQWFAATSGLGSTNVAVDRFSGNGSTTAFTLSGDPGTINNTYVYISGVYQQKNTYTVVGTTLTFSPAPPSGTSNIEVVWTQPLPVGTPSDGTVTAAKMAAGAAAGNLGYTPVNKAGDTLTGALNEAASVTLASAGTVNIGAAASNTINISGTTTITAFDTIAAGAVRRLVFAGALTLTHNATSLILPGAANITTAAGDVAQLVSLGSGNWRCIDYMKANGQPVVAPAGGVTSATAGNGIAVSASTGAVTFSAAAPTFNSVGSYVYGYTTHTSGITGGTQFAAGNGLNQVMSTSNNGGTNNLSGTWRAMGGNGPANGCGLGYTSLWVRVS